MRLYNGCPDAELQAWIDSRENAKREARAEGMHIVWFPIEEAWMCFDLETNAILSEFHSHPRQALEEARNARLRHPVPPAEA